MHTIAEKKILMLRPCEIQASTYQPRKFFDEYELKLLADSIAANGVIEPLTVRKKQEGGYELIAGERRLRAARMAGLRRVPCVLHKTDETTAAFYAITENMQRSDLTFFEEAAAIEKLVREFGFTQSEIAVRLGIAQSTLSNKLRILQLDYDTRNRITAAGLTERHARALLRLPNDKRSPVLNRIIAEGLNLRQTEELIDSVLFPQEEPLRDIDTQVRDKPVRKAAIGDVRLFANSLAKLLETMQSSGIDAHSRKIENEKYIEYKVRINKTFSPDRYGQLKIC